MSTNLSKIMNTSTALACAGILSIFGIQAQSLYQKNVPPSIGVTKAEKTTIDWNAISAGLQNATASNAAKSASPVEMKDATFQLVGTISSSNEQSKDGVALIKMENGQVKVFTINQSIGNGWVLKHIARHQIVIQHKSLGERIIKRAPVV